MSSPRRRGPSKHWILCGVLGSRFRGNDASQGGCRTYRNAERSSVGVLWWETPLGKAIRLRGCSSPVRALLNALALSRRPAPSPHGKGPPTPIDRPCKTQRYARKRKTGPHGPGQSFPPTRPGPNSLSQFSLVLTSLMLLSTKLSADLPLSSRAISSSAAATAASTAVDRMSLTA